MIQEFSKDLSRQLIYAQGDELAQLLGKDRDGSGRKVHSWPNNRIELVATIKNPVLVTDIYKIVNDIDPGIRDTVIELALKKTKTTIYDGVSQTFDQDKYPSVWGPSIDTLLFYRAINKLDLTGVRSVAEIGSGPGSISNYIAHRIAYPILEELALFELNPAGIAASKELLKTFPQARFIEGDATTNLEKEKPFDRLICNPPYIPRRDSSDDNPYEGVNLLFYLIRNADRLLTEKEDSAIITNISSLSKEETYEQIKKVGLTPRVVDSMRVPLKVYNLLNNKDWQEYLIREKGLERKLHDGYEFWQDIEITEIRR